MSSLRSPAIVLAVLAGCAAGCGRRHATGGVDGAAARAVVMRVPAALRVARGLDTLSVELDPEARGAMTVQVQPDRSLGVAYTTRVFEKGATRAESERHGYVAGPGLDPGVSVWRTERDGIPQPGKKYVVEMRLVVFDTDVAPAPHWDPRAGRFRPLLSRTLRQAEE